MLLLVATPMREWGPWTALWTTPCILGASVLIAWGAESAQFFVAQGFALAILAWMQTLPEFAVEAVLAWHQQRDLLLANLTGALRLLIGIGWPMIYLIAAIFHRRRTGEPLRAIRLEPAHSVEVAGLTLPLCYLLFIWWKASLTLWDAAVLFVLYFAYLAILMKLPPESHEGIENLDAVPRAIVNAPARIRILAIGGCFIAGGALIYFTAEPFLGSLISVATAIGIPSFLVIQWFAPVISEFPELASTFYFARQEGEAPTAIMNISSSNINQWTLLVAMLPVVLSLGAGKPSFIVFTPEQQLELLLTLGQSVVALVFLMNMELRWWQALALFVTFVTGFVFSALSARQDWIGFLGSNIRLWIVLLYFGYAATCLVWTIVRWKRPAAIYCLAETWVAHMGRE
jgi:cation:H+ antiporter